jgi:hypothetical protein
MSCRHCGRSHKTADHFKLVEKLSDKGFPKSSKKYPTAHEEASKKEKMKFPRKDYDTLKKMDYNTPRGELLGKNTKKGKIEVSKKVPAKLRKEVAFHEKAENKILRSKRKK